ncbi:alcohol dehydrogenase [Streptomyces sp. WZ.A104]|uniref:quinone oxidoreductase family protein n=1 Tax=Streptomyces sp. WZ.A104 TaxID=2023771 RepID=UPI000BBCC7CF|nr:zinc-binding dehydrogenase [Streptomyces sp. WZ.A104]PCG86447.1 alcohol dehydrogenase [Streptomyces sp. WZ.A104]
MRAIVISRAGGPEVLQNREIPNPTPMAGHHVVNVSRAGVNYADIHLRENGYLAPVEYPITPGNEVMGTLPDGRRVVALSRGGGYAEQTLVHRAVTWEVPDEVTDEQAVALGLQGNTAWHLLNTVLRVSRGDSILIPAAAGGVGSLAVQLAKGLGARVIALAGGQEKGDLVRNLGADHVLDSGSPETLAAHILDVNDGPVTAALEMTGGAVFDATLEALAPRGRMAVYGCVSGERREVSVETLMQSSKAISGFWLPNLYGVRYALRDSMKELFAATARGDLQPVVGPCYMLDHAAQAHFDLENRRTVGKVMIKLTR